MTALRLGRDDAAADAALENMARLAACRGPHDFVLVRAGVPGGRPRARYGCRLCQGQVPSSGRDWYLTGLQHGREHMRALYAAGCGGDGPDAAPP